MNDKRLIVAIIALVISMLSTMIYPVKVGEIKKQVEVNSQVSNSYRVDIQRFDKKLNDLLVELRELKAYMRAKEGKPLE